MAGGGNRAQMVQFNLRSTNFEELLAAVEKTKAKMLANPGFVGRGHHLARRASRSSTWSSTASAPRRSGSPRRSLGQNVRALMGGDKVADFHEGGDTYDIKVRLPPAVLADPGAIGAIPVRAADGPARRAAHRRRRPAGARARRRSTGRRRCGR